MKGNSRTKVSLAGNMIGRCSSNKLKMITMEEHGRKVCSGCNSVRPIAVAGRAGIVILAG